MFKSSRIYIDSFIGNNKVECTTSVWKVKGSNLGSLNLHPKLQIVNNLEQDIKCCYIHPLPGSVISGINFKLLVVFVLYWHICEFSGC